MTVSSHPDNGLLIAAAESSLLTAADDALMEHLADCQRCRNYVQEARNLMNSANSAVAPKATDALLARIQSSRASGVRIHLSDVGDPEFRTNLNGYGNYRVAGLLGLAAATLIAFALASSTSDKHVVANAEQTTAMHSQSVQDGSNALLDAFSPLPAIAYAQGAPLSDGANDPLVNLDGSRLKPGSWTYTEKRITDGTLEQPLRVMAVSLDTVMFNAQPAWRVVETNVSTRLPGADTLWMDRSTLRPISRRWHIGSFEMTETFSANRVDNTVHHAGDGIKSKDYTNVSSAAVNSSGSVIAQGAQLRLALRTQQLHAKWRGVFGASGAVRGPQSGKPARIVMLVAGDKRLELNGVKEDCWRVMFGGDDNQVWYVSKRTNDVVRVESHLHTEFTQQLDLFTAP